MSSISDIEVDPRDKEYIAIRDHQKFIHLKDKLEELWEVYEPFADSNFKTEISVNFYARFWEMHLTYVFLKQGFNLVEYKPNHGPDILIIEGGSKIWIEAVAPNSGTGPDAVPDLDEDEMFSLVPDDKIILRFTNAISSKKQKFDDYLAKGIVSEEDHLIIAVNGRGVNDGIDNEIPYALQAVLPIGNPYVTINSKEKKIINQGYHLRPNVSKISGAEVSTKSFLTPEYSGISAIVYSSTSILDFPREPGRELILIHNPCATNRLVRGWQKTGSELWYEDNKLVGREL